MSKSTKFLPVIRLTSEQHAAIKAAAAACDRSLSAFVRLAAVRAANIALASGEDSTKAILAITRMSK